MDKTLHGEEPRNEARNCIKGTRSWNSFHCPQHHANLMLASFLMCTLAMHHITRYMLKLDSGTVSYEDSLVSVPDPKVPNTGLLSVSHALYLGVIYGNKAKDGQDTIKPHNKVGVDRPQLWGSCHFWNARHNTMDTCLVCM